MDLRDEIMLRQLLLMLEELNKNIKDLNSILEQVNKNLKYIVDFVDKIKSEVNDS